MYTEYIPYNEFVPYAEDLANGEQIHINHDNCTAGADTRRRLYIKRTEDGTNILAYCHNCSLSGSYGKNKYRNTLHKTSINNATQGETGKGESKTRTLTTHLPNDFQQGGGTSAASWSSEHRVWVSKYGITEKELIKYKIGASDSRNAVILPVFREILGENKLIGYQERTFSPKKPKYLTKRNVSTPLWWYSNDYLPQQASNTTVIVEDMLSGIKCSRYQPTIALLGTNLSDDLVAFIIKNSKKDGKFIIFLDDDNRQVRLNQLKIKVKLEQCGFPTKIITGIGKDPKACSDKQLIELLCDKK